MTLNANDWASLTPHKDRLKSTNLRQLFSENPNRFNQFSFSLDDLTLDFSKEKIDADALGALIELAKSASVDTKRDEMFAGEHINFTEDRAVLHTALRGENQDGFATDGNSVSEMIEETLQRMCKFADGIRSGGIKTANGAIFTDVINIGIGGSDLGPAMVTRALTPYRDSGPNLHFVSNVDGAHLSDTIANLDAKTTLVLVASKTFTTQETMANAQAARDWLQDTLGAEGANQHLAALSTNMEGTAKFGIPAERVFGFWDWVGGRYSVWSAIGLPLAISIGAENFKSFLSGARAMDQHFKSASLEKNLPVLMALIGIWRRNVLGYPTIALIPYDQRLERFAAYVQQLDMESNGKQVDANGNIVETNTSPVIWGEPGTNAQHSFFQLIHQGTDVIPIDFILGAKSGSALTSQHELLQANCLAQSQALAFGKTRDEVAAEMAAENQPTETIEKLAPHRTFPGDRPSTTILHRQLDPFTLGRLIALYEHKVFVQGVIWGVNSFDQWGVELGKQLANELLPVVRGEADGADKDCSTLGLIGRLKELN
ncbi:MAG: glucose-6-phosphate isomerase [Rhizobiaceae bacterium]|nr:glucose-6-phosphate isomerase [Rhizobiaceae bacterium]